MWHIIPRCLIMVVVSHVAILLRLTLKFSLHWGVKYVRVHVVIDTLISGLHHIMVSVEQ